MQFAVNRQRATGLSSSVRRGLAEVRYSPAVLLLPVDLAALQRHDLSRLILRWCAARRCVIARQIEGPTESPRGGVPLILPRWLYPRARAAWSATRVCAKSSMHWPRRCECYCIFQPRQWTSTLRRICARPDAEGAAPDQYHRRNPARYHRRNKDKQNQSLLKEFCADATPLHAASIVCDRACLIDVQSVPHANFRDQEAWLARIGFYLLSKLLDVRAQSPRIALPVRTPHLADQLSLRNDHTGATGQTLE